MKKRNESSKSKDAMEMFKTEVANELGVDLKDENLTARNAGKVGGTMVKRLIEQAEENM